MGNDKISILLVEGERNDVSSIYNKFNANAFPDAGVTTTNSFHEAFKLLEKESFDITFVNVAKQLAWSMMDLETLREKSNSAPVITLLCDSMEPEQCRQIKASDFNFLNLQSLTVGMLDNTIRFALKQKRLAENMAMMEQELYQASIDTQERERSRIATDLHDGLGQTLASMNMHLNAVLPDILEQLDDSKIRFVTRLLKLSKRATQETRLISHNLMPSSIEKYGICTAISELVHNMNELEESLSIQLDCELAETRFKPEVELSIYRIVQEIISNTIKHARAGWLKISVEERDNKLVMITRDNGRGIKMSASSDKTGIGMVGMQNRIKALGGEMRVNSVVRKGTEISIEIPACRLKREDEHFEKVAVA